MERIWTLTGVLVLALLVLAVVVGLTHAQEPGAHASVTAQAVTVGSAFTYQGQLKSSGDLVNDTCEIAFRLYDDPTAGSQVGSAITRTIPISDGLFTVVLNDSGQFGPNAFGGEARWLGIKVKCTGDSSHTDLGRLELTAAPYALYALSTGALHGHPVTAPSRHWARSWNGMVARGSRPSMTIRHTR